MSEPGDRARALPGATAGDLSSSRGPLPPGSPTSDWRTAAADALDAQASAIAVALVELDNVHAILEAHRRADSCHELRALAARLRSEASTLSGEARQLRLAAPDPDRRRD